MHPDKNHHDLDYINQLKEQIASLEQRVYLAEMLNDSSIDRVMAFNTHLEIVAWNTACEAVTGIKKSEALGQDFYKLFPKFNDCEAVSKAINMALKGMKVFVPSDKAMCGDAGYYEHHYVPMRDDDGIVVGVLSIMHDAAHRIKAENELKALNKSLARKNKELKEKNFELLSFTHITSHDLKEPLRKIYTFTEMILNQEVVNFTDTGKRHFRRIQAAVQRMNLLTDDILAYAQINTEENLLSDVDLNQLLRQAKTNLQGRINERRAIIKADILPVVQGYRNVLIQLFQNMISNGLKFQQPEHTPEIIITVDMVNGADLKYPDASADASYVCIAFKDNGIGFEQKYADRIFQMFQRLHSGESYPGTGIGLAICKKIAGLHNGFITAESSLGNGSIFRCYLQAGLR